MQYVKELPNGNRVQVKQDQFLVDRHLKGYTQIVATTALVIYCIGKVAKAPKRLRYGGRMRGGAGSVWNGA